MDTIAKRPAEPVLQFLSIRSQAQGRSVSLVGLTVHQDVVVVVGSTAMLVLLLYFILNGRHLLAHWSSKINQEMREFPWVGFFAGRLNVVVIWLSLFVGPCAFLVWSLTTQLLGDIPPFGSQHHHFSPPLPPAFAGGVPCG